MKRTITKLLLPILLLGLMSLPVTAADPAIKSDTATHIEVIFAEDTAFTPDEQARISAYLAGTDEAAVEPRNLMCTLFGHDYEYETVTTLVHKVRDTAPRCRERVSHVGLCTRCDAATSETLSEKYLYCCP